AVDHAGRGSAVGQVATEESGMVKEGRIAVSREQPEEALAVIEDRVRTMGARLLLEGRDWELSGRLQGVGAQILAVRGVTRTYADVRLPLYGEHAARGAAAAIVSLESLLDRALEPEAVREALAGARSPGRLEVVGRRPVVILDGAHNPAGAQ